MIYILVVLYNKPLYDSYTLKGILESSHILQKANATVLIWDNSERASLSTADIELLKQKFNFLYNHCPANKPLSYVYNKVIECINASQQYKYLVLFDDDSKITAEYFIELFTATQSTNADFILPVAIHAGIIISPAKLFFVKGNYFKSIKSGPYEGKLLAINSGMAISLSFIRHNNFRYDLRLKSYGTDNYIMNFANYKRAKYYVMRTNFEHDYNFYETSDLQKKVEVFHKIKQANKIAFSFNAVQLIMINIYNFLASVKNSIKYKSLKFFS
jgi:hypothetical protein